MDLNYNILDQLINIVGHEYATDNPNILDKYSKDYSINPPIRPNYVVLPEKREEVQRIIELANRNSIPVIPRSSGVGFHGNTIPNQGGIVVNMTRMNRILNIDERNRSVRIEPGVTYGQLQKVLANYRLMALNPLSPHPLKSVLSSHLEREPMLIPKFEYGDPVLTMEVILPRGDILRTGSASAPGAPDESLSDLVGPHGPGLDFYRFFLGAQGTLGIVTWMNIKVEYLPKLQKLFFIPFEKVEDLIEPTYRIQRRMIGNECFILNQTYLASILARSENELEQLKEVLPSWTLILCLAGGPRRPEEKIEYEEEVLKEVASNLSLNILSTLPGTLGDDKILLERIRQPWVETDPYWKFREKEGHEDLSFHMKLNRIPEFIQPVYELAFNKGYDAKYIGCYIQPIERGRVCYCEFGLSYKPDDLDEVEKVRGLYSEANEMLYSKGALFTSPYGIQSKIAYGRATSYTATLRKIKNIFDPNNIMNPGKLCF